MLALEEKYYDIKNDICNKIIMFLVKHCHLYSGVYYAIGRKCPIEELEFYINQLKENVDK